MNFISKNKVYFLFGIAFAVILLLLVKLRCGDGKNVRNDTISVKTDTVFVQSKKDTVYIPQLVTVYYPKEKIVSYPDPYPVYQKEKVDTTAILKDFFAVRVYSDTAHAQYGQVIINDTVSQNKIVKRGLSYNFEMPVVTQQITLRAKPRTIVFVGAAAYGNQQSLLYGSEVNLSLKNKQDKIFSLKGLLNKDGNVYYGFGVSIPIKLR